MDEIEKITDVYAYREWIHEQKIDKYKKEVVLLSEAKYDRNMCLEYMMKNNRPVKEIMAKIDEIYPAQEDFMESVIIMYNPVTKITIPYISKKLKERWEELGFVEVETPREFREKQASQFSAYIIMKSLDWRNTE